MLRPHRPLILTGMALLLFSAPCELFPALAWKYVADDLVTHRPSSPILAHLISFAGHFSRPTTLLFSAVIWLFVIYLIGSAAGTLETNLLNRVAQKFIRTLRNLVYHKLQSQSLGYLQRQRTGDLMSRAMGDVDEVQTFIVQGIDVIIGESILWLSTVAIVLWMDWRVAGVSLLPLFLVYFLLVRFNKHIKPIYTAARERLGDVSTRLQENLSGVVVIKIFGREKQEAQRFDQATHAYYDQQIRAINARSLYIPFAQAIGFLSNVFMIGVGGYLLLKDTHEINGFTLGKLLAFRAYWWRLFGPVISLSRVNDMVQRALAASRRIFEVIDAPDDLPDAPEAVSLTQCQGDLALNNITFAYPTDPKSPAPTPLTLPPSSLLSPSPGKPGEGRGEGSRPEPRTLNPEPSPLNPQIVLHNLSLHIPPGQTIALCGPSGSGKSTILNLLVRFYDPAAGSVTLDGRDLRQIERDTLRRQFALVQQETFLFNDSILDNIRYGQPDATMEQVVVAARAANAHAFITALPSGYETKVGERGIRLSGGQKQRISIARAFLANPRVLLLDEPTSSVEPDSEAAIIAALDRLMTGRTTVLTSHRPSLIQQADWVYVIHAGRVTDAGRPTDLADKPGWFSRFIHSADLPDTSDTTEPTTTPLQSANFANPHP